MRRCVRRSTWSWRRCYLNLLGPEWKGFVVWFEQLIADAGLPQSLSEANVPEQDLPMLASDAMQQQRLLVNNPVTVDESVALALYRSAWEGRA